MIRAWIAALLIGAAAWSATPAVAQSAAPAAQPSQLDQLVVALTADDAMAILIEREFDAGFDAALASDAKIGAQYDAHPGARDYVKAQLRSEARNILIDELPSLRAELRALLGKEMNGQEIADTLAFFASPTGLKVKRVSYDAMAKSAGSDPEATKAAAAAAIMANLSSDDLPAVIAFSATSAAGKMAVLNPKVAAVSVAWGERVTAANQSRIRTLSTKTYADFVARHP